jgi:osmoprotectant transport system permease protein
VLQEFWRYVAAHPDELRRLVGQHLELTLGSTGIAALVAIPAGIVATRMSRLGAGLLTLANLGQTVPSIAVLGLVIPVLGIGFVPALFALVLRGLLPIFLNTYVGVRAVDPAIREAALGVGMRSRDVLWQVELPLATPLILAGVRTVVVQNVAVATLAAFIGAGGLGDLILRGLAMLDAGLLLAGAVPAAGLAIGLELGLGWLEAALRPRGLRST